MPRLLRNRVSRTLTADNLQNVRNAVKIILENLGTPTAITDAELEKLAKIGPGLKPSIDKICDIAREHPEYLEEAQSIAEIEKDKALYEQYDEVRAILAPIERFLYREQGLAGAEYRNGVAVFEENVKDKVKKGNQAAEMVLDRVNRVPRPKKGKPNSKKKEEPQAA